MLNQITIVHAEISDEKTVLDKNVQLSIHESVRLHGYCILRDFMPDRAQFNSLVDSMCSTVTFDPARENLDKSVQKVDSGTAAIGLHIENGNTPNVPELVFFYCQLSARHGSHTTLCDGVQLLSLLSAETRQQFEKPITVSRTLPEEFWKAYLVAEHPQLNQIDEVTVAHLEQMLSVYPALSGYVNADNSLTYRLVIHPFMISRLCRLTAFANAILGPSFNYEAPVYEFADGTTISDDLMNNLADLAESITVEIPWETGDIAIIDNWRVMHGRREILDAENRELFIGMGNL